MGHKLFQLWHSKEDRAFIRVYKNKSKILLGKRPSVGKYDILESLRVSGFLHSACKLFSIDLYYMPMIKMGDRSGDGRDLLLVTLRHEILFTSWILFLYKEKVLSHWRR